MGMAAAIPAPSYETGAGQGLSGGTNFFQTDKKATAVKNIEIGRLLPPRDSALASLMKT